MARVSVARSGLFVPLVALLCSSAAGCGVLAAARGTAADVFVPVDQENELGRQMSAEVEQDLRILDDPELQGYVRDLAAQIVAVADDVPEGIEFTVRVVDDPETVNAFALPGGYVYVYTGLLEMAEDEAELVAVLAHEIAHVTQRHIAERLVTQLGVQTFAAVALGREPGIVAQLVTQIAATGYFLQHSREAEREADEVGLAYVVRANYDPRGYMTFFERMAELQQAGQVPTFLQSHPDPRERVENARALIAELDAIPERRGEERYQRLVGRAP